MIKLLPFRSAGRIGQLRYAQLGLLESPRAQWCYLTPCNLKLVLGNRATEFGGLAEHNCAQQQWCQSTNLSGGLADGRLSETFDATLDQIHWRQRQSRSCAVLSALVSLSRLGLCAVFSHIPTWGERLTRAAEERRGLDLKPNRGTESDFVGYFLWLSHRIHHNYSEFRVRLWPWALASCLSIVASTRGVSGHPASVQDRQHALCGPH